MAKTGKLTWRGGQVAANFHVAANRAMRYVVVYLRAAIVRRINVSARAGGAKGARRPGKSRRAKPMRFDHSKPGQPPRKDTGTLVRSIFGQVDPKGWHKGRVVGRVGTTVKYGAFLELGTKPHTIAAKEKKTLCFGYNGKWVYPKAVQHPGMAARPYIHSTVKANRSKIRAILLSRLKAGKLRLG